ncbi:MAG: DUF87 domain-containing protein [Chitinivibrionales bacterium]|nr:DUF87 domain-containing protein [Chitinivibrionales bacterium]
MALKEKSAEKSLNPIDQIWGLIFLAIGLLVLISLVSHYTKTTDNILGPYVGAWLAAGLVYLFGAIPALFFPLAVMYLGWNRLREPSLSVREFVYAGLFTFEICTILAVKNIPLSHLSGNVIGNAGAYLLQMVFGEKRFGPYFVSFGAFFITAVLAFKINIVLFVKTVFFWISQSVTAWQIRRKSNKKRQVATGAPAHQSPPHPKPQAADSVAAPQPREASASDDSPEEQARRQLDAELAEFRARRHEPVKITTLDAAAAADEAEEEEEAGSGYDDDEVALDQVDGGLALNESGDDEDPAPDPETGDLPDGYFKVPESVKVKRKKHVKPYEVPTPDTLSDPPQYSSFVDRMAIEQNSQTLEKTLMNFGVEGKVVNVNPGPVITSYEIELAPGIKVSRVVNLQDDISMAVGGQKIRIQAPIPGKAAIGIELPNEDRQIVYFKHVLTADAFVKSKAKLPVIIGRSTSGNPYVADITKMPHVLIAGQTGSGKSVCINSIICSLLMTKKPEELRLIMIDPKKVELSYYQGIPHLLAPVVTESKEAVKALQWGINEMDRRYRMLAKVGARNIESFNTKVAEGRIKEGLIPEEDNKPLPFIVILVDELADLMLTASKDVEASIQRIAQLARAVGIHLIVATQRPSVDIITGPIKANLTSRIAFRTIQSTDSRTILGHVGSEKLLGMGDMLFLRSGAPDIERYHGAFIAEEDVERLVDTIRSQFFEIDKLDSFKDAADDPAVEGMGGDEQRDELFEDAAEIIVSIGQGSTSMLQRRMKIGYARAGRLMDELERTGIVGPSEGSKAREVLVAPHELEEVLARIS